MFKNVWGWDCKIFFEGKVEFYLYFIIESLFGILENNCNFLVSNLFLVFIEKKGVVDVVYFISFFFFWRVYVCLLFFMLLCDGCLFECDGYLIDY